MFGWTDEVGEIAPSRIAELRSVVFASRDLWDWFATPNAFEYRIEVRDNVAILRTSMPVWARVFSCVAGLISVVVGIALLVDGSNDGAASVALSIGLTIALLAVSMTILGRAAHRRYLDRARRAIG